MAHCGTATLRSDAIRIWRSGVDAVSPLRLTPQWLRVEGRTLLIGNERQCAAGSSQAIRLPLDTIGRIVVVGGGKAGAAMAEAVEELLGPSIMAEKHLAGWVNVPADCLRPLERIHLHAARPAGVNEPTPEGVEGSKEILRLVASLGPDDLCLCLISGGGSALMPAPVEGVTLADKLAVTRFLSAAGANIAELNTVRKHLSRIKGGGLLRACRAGRVVSLIISDVLGDPLDLIASGPTVPDTSTAQQALGVLERFHAREAGISSAVFDAITNSRGPTARGGDAMMADVSKSADRGPLAPGYSIIANNAMAVDAAAAEAKRLGYEVETFNAKQSEGLAESIGRELAERALRMRASAAPCCFVGGGEPVVALVDCSQRGLGGRNQQLVLASLIRLLDENGTNNAADGITILSGGTDGEDGPTDAAGAFVDADILAVAREKHLAPSDYLARNDAYRFFDAAGGLFRTGPTQTNVCDIRVVLTAGS